MRVSCESWAVRLSSLGVDGAPAAPCALCNPNLLLFERCSDDLPTRPHNDSLTKNTHYSPVGLYIDAQARLS